MTKSTNTAPKAQASTSLRERADRLRDAASRLIRRITPAADADQPQPASLPEGGAVDGAGGVFPQAGAASHDAHQGQPEGHARNAAEAGRVPLEHAMGRHETFENAAPITGDLLSSTILMRGSADAEPSNLAEACEWAVHHRAWIDRASREESWTDEDSDRECNRVDAVFTRAIGEPSADLRTIIAKGRLALEDHERFNDGDDDGFRIVRTVLRELSGLSTPMQPANDAGGLDPVFARIEAHRAAYAEWDRTSAVWNGMVPSDPGFAAAVTASDEPASREITALKTLLATQPTTVAGIQAFARYLAIAISQVSPDNDENEAVLALRTIAAARPDINLASRIDFASATMEELQALHGTASMVGDVAHAAAWQGRCQKPGRDAPPNAAGEFMGRLGDALTDVVSAAEKEARRRIPAKADERKIRLELMALAIVENGDPGETTAFAHELAAHAAAQAMGR